MGWLDPLQRGKEGRYGYETKDSLPPSLLWLGVVVPIRVSSKGQIDLFESYSYSIGSSKKEKRKMQQKTFSEETIAQKQ